MIQRYLLLWLVLISLLAFAWPDAIERLNVVLPNEGIDAAAVDPFLRTNDWGLLRPVFAVAMFCIGGLLPRDELTQLKRRWPTVLAGTSIQYTVMPLLAFAATRLFDLDEGLTIGVLLVGCVPGAMASNVLTLAARGNVSYSVSLTTSATLLSPLVVPVALGLTLNVVTTFDPWEAFLNLTTDVVGPVILGHVICRRFAWWARTMQSRGSTIANIAILWIIATVVGVNRERLAGITWVLLAALLLINLLGYAAGWTGGSAMKLPDGMRRALTLEIGMQNAGLGSVLALNLFKNHPDAAIPTAAYMFGCMLTGTVLAQWWGRRPPRDGVAAGAGKSDDNTSTDV
jgi:bile acid:Na+ symporter, BASS family